MLGGDSDDFFKAAAEQKKASAQSSPFDQIDNMLAAGTKQARDRSFGKKGMDADETAMMNDIAKPLPP